MENPIVTVDTTNIIQPDLHNTFRGIFKAELTMINCNSRTIRCRLYDPNTNKLVVSNLNLPISVVVNNTFSVMVR